MNSLKRLVWFAFTIVSILLGVISLLGITQYQLAGGYTKVISQNESALFHYMTIREAITENLITDNWSQPDAIIGDIEKLNGELNRLKENKLVSAELKLALVDKIDLTGLAILLRQVVHNVDKEERSKRLQEQLRSISDSLIQYDRIIAGQARERIVSFQTVVIGALGMIVCLASFSLILLYRNTVSPLIQLAKIARDDELVRGKIIISSPVVSEIAEVIHGLEALVSRNGMVATESDEQENQTTLENILGDAINETTNRLNGIINYAQLLNDSLEDSTENEELKVMLAKIMDSGTEIAGEWQKLK